MKHLLMLFIVVLWIGCSDSTSNTTSVDLETKKDSVSYSIGYDIGRNFNLQMVEVEPSVFAQGFTDAFLENETPLTEAQMREVSIAYQAEHREKQEELNRIKASVNLEAGEAFLAENAEKEGVQTTESGLQYKVITEGSGPVPTDKDRVKVHYTGKLLDDTVFDSSIERGEPAVFGVKQVIKGWSEALQLMSVGSKWELYIPSKLAYGARGPNPTIGPNSTLLFEVELLEIVQ